MTTSDRLLSILSLFTIERPEWTVEAAAGELGLAVSTAYRYFRSLSKAGLIVAFSTGRYVLGPAIIQYDRQMRLRDPLTTAAQPVMKLLSERMSAHTVILLCRLFRNQVMCVHQESAEKPEFAFSYERGRAMPLFRGAASKAILTHMPLRTVKALYAEHAAQFAQASLGRNWEETKECLRSVRNAGFTITEGELDPGMCGIAVPVFEPDDAVVGSLSIVIPARHLNPTLLAEAPQLLKDASRRISGTLSFGAAPASQPSSTQRHKSAEPARPERARKPNRPERKIARRARA